ncbi:hypothetical protein KC360_g7121 [Hortaea werneckii]|nr:hypothetical protein KC325_g7045 [Hortaea werneckii]KAI7001378.1 hypothetical protein KC359_g767 [Hortaea werneckii]KAI7142669.1 hypothetical protein KC344_g7001 [Hortaea werneckii]KAI7170003.1 hypothetical protein KC360_g7121 [Hortaea werneckii]
MPSVTVHPRRRPAEDASPSVTSSLIDSFQNMSLRKGETFHNPTTSEQKNDLWDPLEMNKKTPSMPGRSTTCPKSLEDLLIGAGERRAADLLARVDKAIETQSKLALGAALNDPEVLPVPSFMVEQTDAARPRPHRHSHSSDSGMGSSVADSDVDAKSSTTDNAASPTKSTHSFSTISDATERRGLSKYAAEQIHKYIVQPILQEAALKDFHPLIEGVPVRIGNKEIKNLRDLEKTLIFLAPDHARSPSKYLQFCERTIRVLHTTVTTLHESDQRAPTDRPYTQGYFFDLVEQVCLDDSMRLEKMRNIDPFMQIRRYATILAATREKQAKGEKTDAMDYTEGESVSLHGGMSHTGQPAELVRHTKDGRAISLATGAEIDESSVAASMKRPMLDVDNDDVARSMARRKKGAKPEIHECSVPGCDKEFKRPCDLTKHLKTHERPWKCPDEGCKYHTLGWPTEKECDRHVNDKHSAAPPLYKCLFDNCPYTSKRESNCKQHMEKAHGWQYVRSKNNGKGKAISGVRLPNGSVSASPGSAMLTPLTPILPSPSTHSLSSSAASRHDSIAPPPGVAGPSNYDAPALIQPSSDFAGHFNMDFDFNFNDMTSTWPTPAMSDDHHASSASSTSGLQFDGASSGYEDNLSPQQLALEDFHWDNFNLGCLQQPSPPSANPNLQHLSVDSGFSSAGSMMHPSPGTTAPLDQTFSNTMYSGNNGGGMEMNFDDVMTANAGPSQDFTLFGNTAMSANGGYQHYSDSTAGAGAGAGGEMMPSLPFNEGSSWGTLNFAAHDDPLKELFPSL